MARKIILGRSNWVRMDGVVWTALGAEWRTDLSNMADIRPQFVAEAAGSGSVDTKFKVDLGYHRRVGLFHFANLRASAGGRMRVTASLTDGGTLAYDSGLVSCWPQDVEMLENTPWGVVSPNGVYNSDFYVALGMPRVFISPAIITIRYIYVSVIDETLIPALQIGCFGAYEIWEPPENMEMGWQVVGMDESVVNRVPGGSTYIVAGRMRRRMNFGFDPMNRDEFLSRQLDFMLVKGRSEPLVVVPFPDDGGEVEKTAIYGLISTDSQISNPFYGLYKQTIQIDQLV